MMSSNKVRISKKKLETVMEETFKDGNFSLEELAELYLQASKKVQLDLLQSARTSYQGKEKFTHLLELLMEKREALKDLPTLKVLSILSEIKPDETYSIFTQELASLWLQGNKRKRESLVKFFLDLTDYNGLDVICKALESSKLEQSREFSLMQLTGKLLKRVLAEGHKDDIDDYTETILKWVSKKQDCFTPDLMRNMAIRIARFYNTPEPQVKSLLMKFAGSFEERKGKKWKIASNVIRERIGKDLDLPHSNLEGQHKTLTKQMDYKNEYNDLKAEVDEIKEELKQAKIGNEELQRKLENLESSLREKEEDLEKVKEKNSKLKGEKEDLEKKVGELRARVSQTENKVSEMKIQLNETKEHLNHVIEREEREKKNAVRTFAGKVSEELKPYFENLKTVEARTKQASELESIFIHYFHKIKENLRALDIPI